MIATLNSIIVFLSCTTTTCLQCIVIYYELWIAFNYCIFIVYDHNGLVAYAHYVFVVNCFQLLYFYRVRSQLLHILLKYLLSCELLSIIVFLSCTITTFSLSNNSGFTLWIAFNYCIFIVYDHNLKKKLDIQYIVVNCFQLLYFYRVRPQQWIGYAKLHWCCELLSIIVFLSCTTTTWQLNNISKNLLWIAFNYCIFIVYDHNYILTH